MPRLVPGTDDQRRAVAAMGGKTGMRPDSISLNRCESCFLFSLQTPMMLIKKAAGDLNTAPLGLEPGVAAGPKDI
ncbi:hypothetical protein KQ940_01560 [Marinobacterium sp. D7]|uniref:hypothetical protein n=1 Tax=Marinobacterium ramblicola TaxID=2849041 RepID=UPI001C2D38D9|nr:hypothetical protein [Marinobacterium ramblicola]MBV1786738.1 hypothetical protein [Marinobacterium ramblicola]